MIIGLEIGLLIGIVAVAISPPTPPSLLFLGGFVLVDAFATSTWGRS